LLICAPIRVFEWGQCYTRRFVLYTMDPVQIIANIYVDYRHIKFQNQLVPH